MHGIVCARVLSFVLVVACASSASADGDPLELTILETVNLPWQGPEAIVVAERPLSDVVVTIAIDGGVPTAQLLDTLTAGEPRSVSWEAPAGSHRATVSVRGASAGKSFELHRTTKVRVVPALELTFGAADVDLEARRLRFEASQPPSAAELTLFDLDGAVLHTETMEFEGVASSQAVTWPKLEATVASVGLRVFSAEDTWADASWTPIEVEVPHAPIYFDASAPPSRRDLDAVYAAAREQLDARKGVPGLALYVVGVAPRDGIDAAAVGAKRVAGFLKKRGKLGVPVNHAAAGDGAMSDGAKPQVHTILATRPPSDGDWRPAR